jgi:hypothetical protein
MLNVLRFVQEFAHKKWRLRRSYFYPGNTNLLIGSLMNKYHYICANQEIGAPGYIEAYTKLSTKSPPNLLSLVKRLVSGIQMIQISE